MKKFVVRISVIFFLIIALISFLGAWDGIIQAIKEIVAFCLFMGVVILMVFILYKICKRVKWLNFLISSKDTKM